MDGIRGSTAALEEGGSALGQDPDRQSTAGRAGVSITGNVSHSNVISGSQTIYGPFTIGTGT